jgi:hypothetical protein
VGLTTPVSVTTATASPPPITSFAYDYDESEETLEIIVQSGERFTAGQVQFRGSGFADTGTSWAAVAGEDVTPESTVGAGEG